MLTNLIVTVVHLCWEATIWQVQDKSEKKTITRPAFSSGYLYSRSEEKMLFVLAQTKGKYYQSVQWQCVVGYLKSMEAQAVLFMKGKERFANYQWIMAAVWTQHPSDNSTTNKLNNEAACPTWCVKAVNIQWLQLQIKSQDCMLNRSDRMHMLSFHFWRIYQACLVL